MSKYELCVVLSAKLEEEEKNAALERVKEFITRAGGSISDIDDWGKKRFAYEIDKMNEGYYYFIHFESETAAPAEIEGDLRIMEPVVRFLCVKQGE
jgi:ribosomal protein S6